MANYNLPIFGEVDNLAACYIEHGDYAVVLDYRPAQRIGAGVAEPVPEIEALVAKPEKPCYIYVSHRTAGVLLQLSLRDDGGLAAAYACQSNKNFGKNWRTGGTWRSLGKFDSVGAAIAALPEEHRDVLRGLSEGLYAAAKAYLAGKDNP